MVVLGIFPVKISKMKESHVLTSDVLQTFLCTYSGMTLFRLKDFPRKSEKFFFMNICGQCDEHKSEEI